MSREIGINLAFFFYIHCSQSIKNSTTPAQPNEVKYIFAAAGLRLREAPDLNAKNLVTLPYGAEVEILRKTGIALSLDAYTSGEWVEVKWKDKTGYAFDGYLLDKREFARFDKVFQFVKNKILGKIKNKDFLNQYRIEKDWQTSQIRFNQRKSNSNFTVYTFMPTKSAEGCSFYISSNCINVILDNKDNIVFTDLDYESMGMIEYIDEEIVRFEFYGGEGDGCNSYTGGFSFVYDFKTISFIKKDWGKGESCLDHACHSTSYGMHCNAWGETEMNESFFDSKSKPIKPTAKIKEYFKRTKESEKN